MTAITEFSLDPSYPIVLLPVRVETRFKALDPKVLGDKNKLLVRIYPDDIFADTHEPQLTADEVTDGGQYWTAVWNGTDPKIAWNQLLQRTRSQRAAWIVLAMQPTNLSHINDTTKPKPAIVLPTPTTRTSTWTRAAMTRILPERWTIVAFRDPRGSALTAETQRITAAALALTTSPTPASTVALAPDLQFDEAAAWTMDFGKAVAAGMAVSIDIDSSDFTEGFSRVVVFGVKNSAVAAAGTPAAVLDGANDLAKLFDAHHYTDGLALVPQGTPTNNTHLGPSAYPPDDPGGATSYATERLASLLKPADDHSDGRRLLRAFGIPDGASGTSVFDHVQYAGQDELSPAKAMATALWPATLGYFMEQLAAPVFTDQHYQDAQAYFINNVQGRGPLPAFRVGRVPYGVLPVTNLYSFATKGTTDLEQGLAGMLKKLAFDWMKGAGFDGFGIQPGYKGSFPTPDPLPPPSPPVDPHLLPGARVPRIVPGAAHPVDDLLQILAREASSTAYTVDRGFVGPTAMFNFAHFLNDSNFIDTRNPSWPTIGPPTMVADGFMRLMFGNMATRAEKLYGQVAGETRPPGDKRPPASTTHYSNQPWPSTWVGARIVTTESLRDNGSFGSNGSTFNGPIVAAISSETEGLSILRISAPLEYNYINWLLTAKPADVRDGTNYPGGKAPTAMLFELLRRSTIRMYLRLAHDFLGLTTTRIETELPVFGTVDSGPTEKLWQSLSETTGIPAGSTAGTLGEYLSSAAFAATGTPLSKQRVAFTDALTALKDLPSAELERLFSETLDLASHRLDAWITSLSTTRLAELRAAKPTGCWVGGYAIVEGLKPAKRAIVQRPDQDQTKSGTVSVEVPVVSHGFVQTPSMNHANAAAVLVGGARAHLVDSAAHEVDLISWKARQARFILDEVRKGQPLGAVLGYLVERWMYEFSTGAATDRTDLVPYIHGLRTKFPLVSSNPVITPTADTAVPFSTAAATVDSRNVIDGLKLYTSKAAFDLYVGGIGGDPQWCLQHLIYPQLAQTVAALGDVLLAESVFQLAGGNTAAASASLEGMAQGLRPPDPEFIRAPVSGTSITHRALYLLVEKGGQALALTPNWPAATPRALAEPYLDGWVGSLMGDPAKILCNVTPAHGTALTVSLQSLGLRPLDFLALARAASGGEAESELDLRVIDAAMTALGVSSLADPAITYAPTGLNRTTSRSFQEVLELGAAINSMLSKARPLAPSDLATPAKGTGAGTVDATDATTRAKAALAGLNGLGLAATITAVDANLKTAADLRVVLRKAAGYGLQGAYPPPAGAILADPAQERDRLSKERAQLLTLARSVQAEIDTRLNDISRLSTVTPLPITDAVTAGKVLALAFDRSFIWLPKFKLASSAATELDSALASPPSFGTDSMKMAVNTWFNGASLVRAPLALWNKVRLYSRALSKAGNSWAVAQLPFKSTDVWAGSKMTDPTALRGKVSLVIQRAGTLPVAATDSLAGLYIDEWSEVIPSAKRTTGVAFHYDNPGAEAPQVVLVAVHANPAAPAAKWDTGELVSTILVAMDLAKVRAVTPHEIPHAPSFLPLLYYPVTPDATPPSPNQDTLYPQLVNFYFTDRG